LHSVGAIHPVTTEQLLGLGVTSSARERGREENWAARDKGGFRAEGRQQESRGQTIWP